MKSIPGISTTKFLLINQANSTKILVASTDDFDSLMSLNLAFPADLGADIDRCGSNVSTGVVNIINVVSLKRSLLINTSAGIITVRNNSLVCFGIILYKGACMVEKCRFLCTKYSSEVSNESSV